MTAESHDPEAAAEARDVAAREATTTQQNMGDRENGDASNVSVMVGSDKSHNSEAPAEAGDVAARETTTTQQNMGDKENGDANNVSVPVGSASDGFQHLLEQVGTCGRWQIKIFLVASFCGVFTAFHNLGACKSCWRRRHTHALYLLRSYFIFYFFQCCKR